MKIAIITGEASGDRVGGQLVREIHRLRPDAEIWGTGGDFLRQEGVEVVVDSTRFGIVGIVSGLQVLPRVLQVRARVFTELKRRKPDVVIPIDAGAFNLGFAGIEGVCPWIRRTLPNTKILYYFPPGSWRRTLNRTSLDKNADVVATPFEWSATELIRLGAHAVWVGHPLLDLVKPSETTAQFAERYGIDLDRPIIGLMPGSRIAEIDLMLPRILGAASLIHRRIPSAQFVMALAPSVPRERVLKMLKGYHTGYSTSDRAENEKQRLRDMGDTHSDVEENRSGQPSAPIITTSGHVISSEEMARQQRDWKRRIAAQAGESGGESSLPLVIVENAAYDVMAASDVLLTASGTATLEAAILNKPMVILYALSEWNRPQYLLVKKNLPRYFGLPNLLADREIVPERIQDDATPERLAGDVIALLLEPDRMQQQRAELQKVVHLLGAPGGAARTARMLIDLTESISPVP